MGKKRQGGESKATQFYTPLLNNFRFRAFFCPRSCHYPLYLLLLFVPCSCNHTYSAISLTLGFFRNYIHFLLHSIQILHRRWKISLKKKLDCQSLHNQFKIDLKWCDDSKELEKVSQLDDKYQRKIKKTQSPWRTSMPMAMPLIKPSPGFSECGSNN